MDTKDHKKRTVKGLMYSFAGQGGSQFLRIGLFVILARFFLIPEDFGIYNLALVLIGFSKIIADFGFGKSIIQIENPTQNDFSSAFWINVIIGSALTALIFFLAPTIAVYYKMPALQSVLQVLSVSFLLNSATVIQKVILQRELDFRHLTINDLLSYLAGSIAGLGVGAYGGGVWSLVAFHMTMAVVSNVWLWFYLRDWKPILVISKKSINKILSLSLYLFGNNAIAYLSRNVDKSLIGRHFGDYMLGIYSQAFSLVLIPVTNLSNVISKVMFPSLALIKDDRKKIGGIFIKLSKIILFVNGFVFGFVFLNAGTLIDLVLGDKWIEMTEVLKIFCFVGLLTSLRTIQLSVYLALNKNRMLFFLNLFIRFSTIMGFIWAASVSFDMVVYMALITMAVSYTLTTALSVHLLDMSHIKFIASHFKPILVVGLACGALLTLRHYADVSNIIVAGLVYTAVYAAALYIAKDSAVEYLRLNILKRTA